MQGKGTEDLNDGPDGADVLYGGKGSDIIYGNAGNDKIYGEGENDYLFGNDDADLIVGDTGKDVIFGDDGYVLLFQSDDTITKADGTTGSYTAYTVDLGFLLSVASTDPGDDNIDAGQDVDYVFGGPGDGLVPHPTLGVNVEDIIEAGLPTTLSLVTTVWSLSNIMRQSPSLCRRGSSRYFRTKAATMSSRDLLVAISSLRERWRLCVRRCGKRTFGD